jgi:alpha-glucosidase
MYTLAWEASRTGVPLARPLWWDSPSDSRLWHVDDAFLLGRDLLVAPVVQQGARRRSVELPDGTWQELGTERRYVGGGSVEVDAPLETIPVLVRCGAILPLDQDGARTLSLYPPHPPDESSSESTVYDDEGDGYGGSLVVRYRLRRDEHRVELQRVASEGSYPPPATLRITLAAGTAPSRAIVDGREAQLAGATTNIPGDFDRLELTVV